MSLRWRNPIHTALIILITSAVGCSDLARGIIYTDTIKPLCLNLRGKPLGSVANIGATKAIEIPTTSLDLTTQWDSRALGDIAKRTGMKSINGCDLRIESYVLGIWRRDEVIVYGE